LIKEEDVSESEDSIAKMEEDIRKGKKYLHMNLLIFDIFLLQNEKISFHF